MPNKISIQVSSSFMRTYQSEKYTKEGNFYFTIPPKFIDCSGRFLLKAIIDFSTEWNGNIGTLVALSDGQATFSAEISQVLINYSKYLNTYAYLNASSNFYAKVENFSQLAYTRWGRKSSAGAKYLVSYDNSNNRLTLQFGSNVLQYVPSFYKNSDSQWTVNENLYNQAKFAVASTTTLTLTYIE